MKPVYLALGLIIAGNAVAASISSHFGVTLTLTTQCSVNGITTDVSHSPLINCGGKREAEPKVMQSVISERSSMMPEQRLVTVEW